MRIAFVTSGLEPGHNGVGDYTTLLAAECERAGHATCRVALNDREADAADASVGELRLHRAVPWASRAAQAERFLAEFAPDFVSLQFVCYGFHPRGFVGSHVGALLRRWPMHVFLHELWLGDEVGAAWKHRAIGWLQRRGVLALVNSPAVRLVHTSNEAYVHLLSRRGVAARTLPLFGSLPLPTPGIAPPSESLAVALFGTLHPVWPAEPLFSTLRGLNRTISITHAGGIGAGGALWERLAREDASHFTFRRLGAQPPQAVADLFAASHCGIATTPWALIGKSASAAAMLDAGLPVIVNRDDVHFRDLPPPPFDPLLLPLDEHLAERLRCVTRRPPKLRLPEVAARFLTECTEVFSR